MNSLDIINPETGTLDYTRFSKQVHELGISGEYYDEDDSPRYNSGGDEEPHGKGQFSKRQID